MSWRHKNGRSDESSCSILTETEREGVEAVTVLNGMVESGNNYTNNNGDLASQTDSGDSFVCERNPETGGWECLPYKAYVIRKEVERASRDTDGKPPYAGIVNELKNLGCRVYIVSYSSDDVVADVHKVVQLVSNDDRKKPLREKQRCLLYRDERNRVFNLKIKGESSGLAESWKLQLLSFSGFEAIVALTVLCRAFPCISLDGSTGVRPGYLSLIIGLVLSEEIGQVFVNVSMLIRGTPSISAYALTGNIGMSDWPRKLIVFSLAMASAAPTDSLTQRWMTFGGILLACMVLAANLGARAWNHLSLNPLAYSGPGASVSSFLVAMMTGLIAPYIGHREVQAGGKGAMEAILRSALFAAIIFIISDINEVQQFVIVGSEECNQDGVNLAVGVWFLTTLLTSIFLAVGIKPYRPTPEETEPILEEDHSSPVGYIVPNLPHVEIDPALGEKGLPCCSLKVYIALGVLLAFSIAGVLVFMAFSEVDDEFGEQVVNSIP